MQFRTPIHIPSSDLRISHSSKMVMLGSCFSQHIGEKLEQSKFNINLNPFGVLYNPVSIAQALRLLIGGKQFSEEDIFKDKGIWNSFYHHGSYSNTNKKECLRNINESLNKANKDLLGSNILFITFGTSYVYELVSEKRVVGNCHKLPAAAFTRYRLSVADIVKDWQLLLGQLTAINPLLKVVFTVSPIRHLRDGAHDNQLSKAVLLLAIEELCATVDNTSYFPSYEIVLDELRDYRFYKEDMTHPSSLAIDYIWQRLGEIYFDDDTYVILKEWSKLHSALLHRPINEDSEEHKQFLKQTLLRLYQFETKYPYICLSTEKDKLMTYLEG